MAVPRPNGRNKEAEDRVELRNKKLSKLWAIGTELWGKDVADQIYHAYIAMNYGKRSLRELTEDELDALLDWLKGEIYGGAE